jgi:hypothetical protein
MELLIELIIEVFDQAPSKIGVLAGVVLVGIILYIFL